MRPISQPEDLSYQIPAYEYEKHSFFNLAQNPHPLKLGIGGRRHKIRTISITNALHLTRVGCSWPRSTDQKLQIVLFDEALGRVPRDFVATRNSRRVVQPANLDQLPLMDHDAEFFL